MKEPTARLSVVDALRGFALLAIVLLHNLEHYNLYFFPQATPDWLQWLDKIAWDTTFFVLAGNAYATFSLLFGFSFYIQMRNARARGCDFRMRFAWRMVLLACFAMLHSLFYNGDILLLYAVCGLILIPASSLSNRTLVVLSLVLMAQPFCWGKMIYALFNPDYVDTNSLFVPFAQAAEQAGMNGNILQTLWSNLHDGILYSNLWQIEAGRLSLTPALFMTGMVLGRTEMFIKSPRSQRFWRKALIWAIVCAVPLYLLRELVPPHISNITIASYYGIAVPRMFNVASMTVLVSLFILCWFHAGDGYRFQRSVIDYGRMSLTNYITQSIIGVAIYYHCGLGLYDKTGAVATLLIGLGIFAIQLAWSRNWLTSHKQGPLEMIWKRLTWLRMPATPAIR